MSAAEKLRAAAESLRFRAELDHWRGTHAGAEWLAVADVLSMAADHANEQGTSWCDSCVDQALAVASAVLGEDAGGDGR